MNAATSSDSSAVAIRGVTHRYGERVALDDLSLEIATGEIFDAARTVIEAKFKSFSLARVFEYLKQSRAGTTILVIDACRSNPVAVRGRAKRRTCRTEPVRRIRNQCRRDRL